MIVIEENVALASRTTLGVGGAARYFLLCSSEGEILEALAYARQNKLPVAVLGGGSNTLAPDIGFDGFVLKVSIEGVVFDEVDDVVLVTAGAGVSWDALVREVGERGLWGIENLSGIPGTVGGAVVQNIGAYGEELSQVFVTADTIMLENGERGRVVRSGALFAYRASIFKQQNDQIITNVTLRLLRAGEPNVTYPDLARIQGVGNSLLTPVKIAAAVREIRAKKFPQGEGTAGSFFKNPIVEKTVADALQVQFRDLVTYPASVGRVKISLAWILDHVLHLKGYREGSIRLYEQQPLVLVAGPGASARDIDAFANKIRARVKEATGLMIEREVETLSAKK